MSKQGQRQTRVTEEVAKRLERVASRDGFSLPKALDTVARQALPDLESGKAKLGTTVLQAEEESA